jgi:hypothetical protein
MRRAWVIMVSLCLGGCATYRSVSGRIYGPDAGALDAALQDSGSTSLQCDPGEVRVRHFVTGGNRHYQSLLIAEGCGQRASYVVDCSDHAPAPYACPGGGLEMGPMGCSPHQDYKVSCELVLVSKVNVD